MPFKYVLISCLLLVITAFGCGLEGEVCELDCQNDALMCKLCLESELEQEVLEELDALGLYWGDWCPCPEWEEVNEEELALDDDELDLDPELEGDLEGEVCLCLDDEAEVDLQECNSDNPNTPLVNEDTCEPGLVCLDGSCEKLSDLWELCDLCKPLPAGKPLFRLPVASDGRTWADDPEALETEAAEALLRGRQVERLFGFDNRHPEVAGSPIYAFSNRPVPMHDGLQRDLQLFTEQRGKVYRFIDIRTRVVETPAGELAVDLTCEAASHRPRSLYLDGKRVRVRVISKPVRKTYLAVPRGGWLEFHRKHYPLPPLDVVSPCWNGLDGLDI